MYFQDRKKKRQGKEDKSHNTKKICGVSCFFEAEADQIPDLSENCITDIVNLPDLSLYLGLCSKVLYDDEILPSV